MIQTILIILITAIGTGCSPTTNTPTTAPEGTSSGLVLKVDQDLQDQSLHVLQSRCAFCHGDASTSKVNHITDVQHLIKSGLIIVGDPEQGRLIGSIAEGRMPPKNPLAAADLQILKNWIGSMQWVPANSSMGN